MAQVIGDTAVDKSNKFMLILRYRRVEMDNKNINNNIILGSY